MRFLDNIKMGTKLIGAFLIVAALSVLVGFFEPGESRLLLSALPMDAEPGEATLAAWDEVGLPPPPKGIATKLEALSEDGRDLPGLRLEIPWRAGDRVWMPTGGRLWHGGSQGWTLWALEGGRWRRLAAGPGMLNAHPPQRMALVEALPEEGMVRKLSSLVRADWTEVAADALPWPAWDAAWAWRDTGAVDAWDQRWNESSLPPERQRQALFETYLAAARPGGRAAGAARCGLDLGGRPGADGPSRGGGTDPDA